MQILQTFKSAMVGCVSMSLNMIAETVITRIFYSVAKAKGRAITVSMLKTTQFMQVLNELDSETDINNVS